jgi:PAT family beta-lactamase induction signal transducer AmpG
MNSLVLSRSPRVRYATGALMYFAQGIPQGLLAIALPAWLVSEGATAAQIGSYMAVIALPWAFKLVTGPLMDRFEYLPMGRRRPWVLGAQAGLSAALLALALVEDPAAQVGLLSLIGFLVNAFAATQDVATDGMSIDITPQQEQGRLNAFMSFGKAMGWSATAAVSGVVLMAWGLASTAVLASLVSAAGVLIMLAVRERPDERILPWSQGAASQVSRSSPSFGSVMGQVNQVIWSRTSVILLGVMFTDGLIVGYGHALMPFAAVNLFGYTTAQWSQLVAVMGLVGAVLALGLGPLIDRVGAKRMVAFAATLVGLHALTLSLTQHLWENTFYVRTMLALYVMLGPIVMVTVLALAMAICSGPVSATQFAIYMSMANLGGTVGAKLFGTISEHSSYVQSYALMAALVLVMIAILVFYRHHPQGGGPGQRERPRHATVGVVGAGAASFLSGAIRCPKCRCDMEQLHYDSIEVDRCQQCQGLWFDADEIEALGDLQAAAVLDTGDAATGRQYDAKQEYPCPRCSGVMERTADERQPHINFETCRDCGGSYLDAGELRDLAN